MTAPIQVAFARRENSDGTIDSICRRCYVTVRTSISASELESAEKAHVCDPSLLAHWSEIQERKRSQSQEP